MARHKDAAWNLPEGQSKGGTEVHSWESIHSALLMDIRDELKAINATLGCSNFLAVPRVLRTISRNTAKPRRRRKAGQ